MSNIIMKNTTCYLLNLLALGWFLHPAQARTQFVTLAEDSAVVIELTSTEDDDDVDEPLIFLILQPPQHGALSAVSPLNFFTSEVIYTPDPDFHGDDSFAYTVLDEDDEDKDKDKDKGKDKVKKKKKGKGDDKDKDKDDDGDNEDLTTVIITVSSVNDAPVAKSIDAATVENTSVGITLVGSDVEDDPLTFFILASPTEGVLTGVAPNLTYTPDTNSSGTDSFTYGVNDGALDSTPATVTIIVTPVNNPPVAIDQTVATDEDVPVTITLGGSDADGDSLTFSVVSGPANGTLSGTAPNLTYTPNTDFNGNDSFTFITSDVEFDSNEATILITVKVAANNAPVADAKSLVIDEDTALAASLTGSDVDGDALTFSVVNGPANGTLSGTAPILTYTPNTDFNGTDAFTFVANDGLLNSSTATVSITVNAVNDAPEADDQPVVTDEDVPVDVLLTAFDVDGNTLTFIVTSGPSNGILGGTAPNLIYTPDADFEGLDSFTFVSNDGTVDSAEALVDILIVAVNDAPEAVAQAMVTDEDAEVVITLTGSDVDGDVLTFAVVTGPANGTLSGTLPNLTYIPDGNFNGLDSFTFVSNDSVLNSVTAAVAITVNAVNDAPVADEQVVVSDEDTAVAIALTGSDVDGDPLTFSVTGGPTNGTLSGTSPNLTYTPDADFNGADSFTFIANDGTIDSAAAIVSITVNTVNDAPVADDQTVVTDEDTPLAITLTGSDVDGDPLAFSVTSGPANGSLSGTLPNLTYTPGVNFNGLDSFTFVASDGLLNSVTAVVSITVNAINDAPVADDRAVVLDEDTSAAIALTGTDVDGDALTFSVSSGPANGSLSGITPNLTYTPKENFNGADTFTFVSSDGLLNSVTATVSITVNAINDAPVADDQAVATDEDTLVAIILTGSDVDGNPLTFSVTSGPANGSLGGTAPNLTYTPGVDFNGLDSFTFLTNDGLINSSAATVSITVNAVNDAPVADDQLVTTDEDTAVAITLTGSDVDGDALTFSVTSGPANGSLSGTAPNLTYTPGADFNGLDNFTFVANDGLINSSAATVSITVNAVNDAPTADDQPVVTDEDIPVDVILTASDVDGDPLTFSVINGPSNGVLSGTAPALIYTPNADFEGPDSFIFIVNDGAVDSAEAVIDILVEAVNDAPEAVAQAVVTDEDVATAITLTGSDVDGDALSFAVVIGPGNGILSGTAPNLTYTPGADFNGLDSFTFIANDGLINSSAATVSITVNAINDAPVADAQSIDTDENTSVAITLTGSDIDSAPLTFTVVGTPLNGTLSGTAPNLVYSPNAGFVGSDSFTFKINDGVADSLEAVITLNVINVASILIVDAGPDQTVFSASLNSKVGKIFANNDEWTLSDVGFQNAPSAGQFVRNLANWFTGGRPGSFLAYSNSFAFNGTSLASEFSAAGHSFTQATNVSVALDDLLQFDAILLAEIVVDNQVLIDYVEAGGSVYLASGTGISPIVWNNFLNHFGLEYSLNLNGINGSFPIASMHPTLIGVDSLYFNNGNNVINLSPLDFRTEILLEPQVGGLLGVSSQGLALADLSGIVTEDGQPPTALLNTVWALESGPDIVLVENPNELSTQVSLNASGIYSFSLIANDGFQSVVDQLFIEVVLNEAPLLNAGLDLILTDITQPVQLNGFVADDGLPPNIPLQVGWSVVTGPGIVTFADETSANTTANFDSPGIYTLELRVDDSVFLLTDRMEVRIGILYINDPFSDLVGWWPGNGTFDDRINGNDGLPGGGLGFIDAKVSLGFDFDGIDDSLLIPAFPQLDVGLGEGFTVEFWVNPGTIDSNQTLFGWIENGVAGVNATHVSRSQNGFVFSRIDFHVFDDQGGDHVVNIFADLLGVFTHFAFTYDKTSGIAEVYRNGERNAQLNLGSFTPDTKGDLVFGNFSGFTNSNFPVKYDEITLYKRVLESYEIFAIFEADDKGKTPIDNNLSPVVDSGGDLSVAALNTSAPLSGFVSDDGLPSGSTLNIMWNVLSAPAGGIVSILDPLSAQTSASFSEPGIYVLELTANDGLRQSSDILEVRVAALCTVTDISGQIGWWAGNQTADDRLGLNNGFVLNGVNYAPAKVSDGFFMDGANDELFIPGSPSLNVGADQGFTVEFWVNPESIDSNQTLFGWIKNGVAGVNVTHISFSSNGFVFSQINFHVVDDQGGDHVVNIFTDLLGEFTHFAFSYDKASGMGRMYRNGNLLTENFLGSFTPATGGDLHFGRTSGFTNSTFPVLYDEISLYNRALSRGEINQIFVSAETGKCPENNNEAPFVSGGFDQAVPDLVTPANLNGVVFDDGLPLETSLVSQWSLLAGPAGGVATFADTGLPTTTATFNQPGIYVLELSANDGSVAVSDAIEVRVAAPCVLVNPPGLVSWFPGNGNGNDMLNNNTLALFNGTGYGDAQVGAGFSLDGVDDQLLIPESATTNLGLGDSFSVELWVKLARGDLRQTIWGWDNAPGVNLEYNVSPQPRLRIILRDDQGVLHSKETNLLTSITQFNHVVITYDKFSKVVGIIVNDQPFSLSAVESDPTVFTPETSGDLSLGRSTIGFVNGGVPMIIDEFSLYNRALDWFGGEVGDLFNAGANGKCAEGLNQPPVVHAGFDQTITLPDAVGLAGFATDDGLPSGSLTAQWTQVSGPAAAVFGDAAALSTVVDFPVDGVYVLQLSADDGERISSDSLTIFVQLPPNNPPTVNAGVDQTVAFSSGAELAGSVSDDGFPLGGIVTVAWSQVSGPGTATFNDALSPATAVSFDLAGVYVLRLTADDGELLGSDEVSIDVINNSAPTISFFEPIDGQGFELGTSVQVTVDAFDTDGAVALIEFFQDGIKIFDTPNSPLTTLVSGLPEGRFVFTARATDNDGLQSEASATIDVVTDPGVAPSVEILSPLDSTDVTAPTSVIGNVTSSILDFYELQFRFKEADGSGEWSTIGSGTAEVANGEVGVLDPTLQLNGIYEMRLTAKDLLDRMVISETITVIIDGTMKVGNFALTFEDLNVPVTGIPIQITRSYDSRDKRLGDFGFGWSLGVGSGFRLQKNRNLALDWTQVQELVTLPVIGEVQGYSLKPDRRKIVTITFPDDEVFTFEAKADPEAQQFTPIRFPDLVFEPVFGTLGSLEAIVDTGIEVIPLTGAVELFKDDFSFEFFNPTRFKFTSVDGTVYVLDEALGLVSVTDRNGNTLTISANGVTHSSGKNVVFNRDGQGRISSIVDPLGNSLTYDYDANGDLVRFTNRALEETTYTYYDPVVTGLPPHTLENIFDPRGVRAIRTEYDASGRVTRQIDADGNPIEFTHDIANQREVITDRLGNPTTHEYDLNGNVIKTTDALGNVTTRTYDANDNEISVTDALLNVTVKTYDASDNLLTETIEYTDGNGIKQTATTAFNYDANRNPLTITDARGNPTTFTYDPGSGNLLTQLDAEGSVTAFSYDGAGNLDTLTDAEGNVTDNTYDPSGNLTRVVVSDSLGAVLSDTSFTYNGNGNQLTQTVVRTLPDTTVENILTQFAYDGENRLVLTTFNDGSTVATTYNAFGKEETTTDQLGRVTSFDYDDRGNLIRTTFPDLTTTGTTYDLENRQLTTTDQLGRMTTFEYDALGRLTATIFPDGTPGDPNDNPRTTTTYDALGRVVTQTDENGNATTFQYDENCGCSGRRTKTIDALLNETAFVYDASGNQLSVTDANLNTTTFSYDLNNRPTVTIFPDATTTLTAYDGLGRRVGQTDQEGNKTDFVYDGLGRLIEVIQPAPVVGGPRPSTLYGYDEAGNQISQIDAEGRETKFEHDSLGRRTKRILPGGQEELFAYDAVGNLISRTDFNGNTTTFAYDVMNRLLSETPDAAAFPGAAAITFTYTATGQRATMTDANGLTTFTYDERDRLTSKATSDGTLTYSYDAAGNLLSTTSSNVNGVAVSYQYDALNRLSAAGDENFTPPATNVYGYDSVGNLQNLEYANGVTHFWSYDNRNRLDNLVVTDSGGVSISSFNYALDLVGNRTQMAELSGRVVDYTYDKLYRLTDEVISGGVGPTGAVNYQYDDVGNRLSRTSTLAGQTNQSLGYDNNDRILTDTFDSNGNTVASGGNTDEYDFKNRLIQRTQADGTIIDILYDGDGNRVAKTITPFGGPSVTTKYLVDTNNLTGFAQVLEEIESGTVIRVYTYGLDLISIDQDTGGQFEISYYLYDGLGSVRGLTDLNSNLTDTYDYDAFGNPLTATGTTPNNYRYTGEQFDEDLGLYFLRARYLNTQTGRFHTKDTFEGFLREPLSLHKYLYVNGNPMNFVDASGNLTAVQAILVVGFIAVFVAPPSIGTFIALTSKAHDHNESLKDDCSKVDLFLGGLNNSLENIEKSSEMIPIFQSNNIGSMFVGANPGFLASPLGSGRFGNLVNRVERDVALSWYRYFAVILTSGQAFKNQEKIAQKQLIREMEKIKKQCKDSNLPTNTYTINDLRQE